MELLTLHLDRVPMSIDLWISLLEGQPTLKNLSCSESRFTDEVLDAIRVSRVKTTSAPIMCPALETLSTTQDELIISNPDIIIISIPFALRTSRLLPTDLGAATRTC